MSYHLLKLIHILSATLMIGTGLGSAFYLFFSYLTGRVSTVKDVLVLVIKADYLFTAPSVAIQIITGIILSKKLGLLYTNWFWTVLFLSFLVFILWLRAVFIQNKLKRILMEENRIGKEFDSLMRYWVLLGIPSFTLAIYIYYLMVYKSL